MKLTLFVLLGASLCSCDPSRRITMVNAGADTAHIMWVAREDSLAFNPFILHNSRELTFVLPPGKNKKINLRFGEGTWSESYVTTFVRHLDALHIITPQFTLRLDSAEGLKNYFISHRKKNGNVVEVAVQ